MRITRRTGLRTLSIVAAGTLLLAACGEAEEPAGTDAPEPETEETAADDDVETVEEDEEEDGEVEQEAAATHTFEDGDRITWIVPTAPGGGFDTQTRIAQPYFEAALQEVTGVDVQIQVESMPGGGHLVGMEFAYQADPDGLTILYAGSAIGTSHQVFGETDLEMRDFTFIGGLGLNDMSFAKRSDLDLPSNDWEGIIARSQEEPLLVGHTGRQEQLEMMVGILEEDGVELNLEFVTLEGTSGVMTALLRDEIELGMVPPPGAAPFVDDNPDELELLFGLGCNPHPVAPDMPVLGQEDSDAARLICETLGEEWRGVFAPPGTDPGNAQALAEALAIAVQDEEMIAELQTTGFEPGSLPPEAMTTYINTLVETWQGFSGYVQ
jgi:tripartite-type tricarboxylate transporter receptor subunit TctC